MLTDKIVPSRSSPKEKQVGAETSRELAVAILLVRTALPCDSHSARKSVYEQLQAEGSLSILQQTSYQRSALSTNLPVSSGGMLVSVYNDVRLCVCISVLLVPLECRCNAVYVHIRVCCVLVCACDCSIFSASHASRNSSA